MAYFEKDFIKRQIRQLTEMLSRVLGQAKSEGNFETGLEAIRKTCGEALGIDSAIIGRMTSASVAQVINDPERLKAYAWLLEQEAELHELKGDAATARDRRRRALEISNELSRHSGGAEA
jgi:hypothetical protein